MDLAIKGYPYAKTALDEALHDIKGKALGVPVYELLGGLYREEIPLAHSLGWLDYDEATAEAAAAVAEGIRTIKIKVGRYGGVRRADRARGPTRPWATMSTSSSTRTRDGPRRSTPSRSSGRCRSTRIRYAEQPVEGSARMAQIARAVDVPIMADESAWTPQDVLEIVERGAADMISLYTTKPGGLFKAKKVAAVAEAAGLPLNVNGSHETGVGNAANLHLVASTAAVTEAGVFPVTTIKGRTSPTTDGGQDVPRRHHHAAVRVPRRQPGGPLGPRPRDRARRGQGRPSTGPRERSMTIQRVAVLGAGNGGCAAAADLGSRGLRGPPLQPVPRAAGPLLERGGIEKARRRAAKVSSSSPSITDDLDGGRRRGRPVMLTVPISTHPFFARAARAEVLRAEQVLFLNPGHMGGGLFMAHEIHRLTGRTDVRICEASTLTLRVPDEGPATVNIHRRMTNLPFAAFPGRQQQELTGWCVRLSGSSRRRHVLETGFLDINAVEHPPQIICNAGLARAHQGRLPLLLRGHDAVGRPRSSTRSTVERMAVAEAAGVPTKPFVEVFHEMGYTTAHAAAGGVGACRAPGERAEPMDQGPAASITGTSTRTSDGASCPGRRWDVRSASPPR